MVTFKTMEKGKIRAGDTCILGLDVGSTTTKAVLVRKGDNAMLASVYLLTSGDPVGASRQCYRAILDQVKQTVDPSEISIEGLGVCGSGRQIAGLHALTDGVINEIIAHAAAAVFFDPQVDTIFEIGGQDAKYTYITNEVASDYAMNEACSAGTGSFLEESAHETLGVAMEDIADIALKGKHPPNFNDQCAAFITSDIKNAIHEGVEARGYRCRTGLFHLHELLEPGQREPAGGGEGFYARRCLLQPGDSLCHGIPGGQTDHRSSGARTHGRLWGGAWKSKKESKKDC